uniref:DNA/RNA non-specific endonuclease domain-containing protein n=1 Tax=Glossina brevipalpis TaxID=37001 RepID=A0A1A9W8V1_9MUSC
MNKTHVLGGLPHRSALSYPLNYESQTTLECKNNIATEKLSGKPMDSIELKCKKPPFRLYRPNVIDNGYYEEYPWCPRSSLYFIGAVGENSGDQFASVLCYSVTSLSVKVLYYEYLPLSKPEVWPEAPDITSYIGAELVNAVPKDPHLIVSTHFTNAKYRNWFNFAHYAYASVLPKIVSDTLRENLSSLFNIMWWSNLLMGNWKQYRENLRKYVQSSEGVKILSGTYGEVKVPINKIGSSNQFEMSVLRDDSGRTIPQYIWNDVQPVRKGEKHFVIFGFNSPFYEYFPKSDVVLCKSMCEEIEWLSDLQESFRNPQMGAIFCCLHEDIIKMQLLEGLGKEIYSPLDSIQSNKCLSSDFGSDQKDQIEEVDRDELRENSPKQYQNNSERTELGEDVRQVSDFSENNWYKRDQHGTGLDESYENSREQNQDGNDWNKSAEYSNEESDSREENQNDNQWYESCECTCERSLRDKGYKPRREGDRFSKSFHRRYQPDRRAVNLSQQGRRDKSWSSKEHNPFLCPVTLVQEVE